MADYQYDANPGESTRISGDNFTRGERMLADDQRARYSTRGG
jgi:hypothetical protein